MTTMPYEFSEPGTPETGIKNEPSIDGALLGAELARLSAPHIAQFMATFPDHVPPCGECAFVKGALGNRCVSSTMDALKCVVEGSPFMCHKGANGNGDPRRHCVGWLANVVGKEVAKAVAEGAT